MLLFTVNGPQDYFPQLHVDFHMSLDIILVALKDFLHNNLHNLLGVSLPEWSSLEAGDSDCFQDYAVVGYQGN